MTDRYNVCDNCGAYDPSCVFIARGESLLCYVCAEDAAEDETSEEQHGYKSSILPYVK